MRIKVLLGIVFISFQLSAQEMGRQADVHNPKAGDYFWVQGYLPDWCSWSLRPDLAHYLDDYIDTLKKLPDWKFRLEVHTDCRASTAYNDTFSQARADTLLNFMLSRGFPDWRIEAKGMGERMLYHEQCSCELTDPGNRVCTEREHQLNRRLIIRLVEKIHWTGFEPFDIDYFSPNQYLAFEVVQGKAVNRYQEVYKLDSIASQLQNANYTLYVIDDGWPKKEKRKLLRTAESHQSNSSMPSRITIRYIRRGRKQFGIRSGIVLQVNSINQ